jgi:hypothetical protein
VVVGAKFNTIFATDVNGTTAVDLHKIHDYERVLLPPMQPVHS